MWNYMMNYRTYPNSFFGGGMILMMLIAIVIVVAIIYFMRNSNKSDAVDILNNRLARGEITVEEYNKMKETMK